MIIIPLTNDPEQQLTMNIFGTVYDIRITLNTRGDDDRGKWDIGFFQGDTNLITGLALVGGTNIMIPNILNFNYMAIVNLDDPRLDPPVEDFAESCALAILSDAEVETAEVLNGLTI